MMLTTEQLLYIRLRSSSDVSSKTIIALLAHIDAQQARIADLKAKLQLADDVQEPLLDRLASLEKAVANSLGGPYYMDMPDGGSVTLEEQLQRMAKDAARYRQLRRGQQWSVIDGIGDALRAGDLDAAIDAAMQPTWPEDTSDYGSRIAVIGQNGATGDHY